MAGDKYITVILPLALPKNYTYLVNEDQVDKIIIGQRVEVELKRKIYTGIVGEIVDVHDSNYKPKPIISVVDDHAIISEIQLSFWKWIANYYCCTEGEVMQAALPSGLKLESETKLSAVIGDHDFSELTDDEYLIAEAMQVRKDLTFHEIKDILNKSSIHHVVRSLMDKGMLEVKEEVIQKYKEKQIKVASFSERFLSNRNDLTIAMDLVQKSEKQTNALLSMIQLTKDQDLVPLSELITMSNTDHSVFNALEKKGIINTKYHTVSRLDKYKGEILEVPPLSEEQSEAIRKINLAFNDHKSVLLHGITGSGKTRVYMELIQKCLDDGKQVLYLLPEIALTTQVVDRLLMIFGNDILLYHSKLTNQQRVEIWNEILLGKKIILGARSALFLPFNRLGLIIVDEEHDPSYKQSDPSPRYNARDCALVLAGRCNANVILGSATPSIESYVNTITDKYELVTLNNRYGDSVLPQIDIVDLKRERQVGLLKSFISIPLQHHINEQLSLHKQTILFQNRRGFSPMVQCEDCGWVAQCINCDVSLTLHKFTHEMRCHYCNYRTKLHHNCPDCGSDKINEIGFGTEKIAEEVQRLFPEARIGRLDVDTAKTKNAMDTIINDFQNRSIDILIGTQMVTKGFDFDHISLVGIINADSVMRFADFRATERAFQLMTQVAGRAGRRDEQGRVIIQTYSADHPVITDVINHDYLNFFNREVEERKMTLFPPFTRLIEIELKHKDFDRVDEAANFMAHQLKHHLQNRVNGPIVPSIARLKNMYLRRILIRIEKDHKMILYTKNLLLHVKALLLNKEGIKSTRIHIDVDPY